VFKRIRQLTGRFVSDESHLHTLKTGDNASALNALFHLKEREWLQTGKLCRHDLSGARLNKATFARAELRGVNFSGARLHQAYFYQAQMQEVLLVGADLSDANLRAAILPLADLSRATCLRANLARVDLSGARLQSTNLQEANLWNADLQSADLTDADLSGANMTNITCDDETVLPDGSKWSADVDWSRFGAGT
jgi:uncharacterized protein YjbI with pentapeptide repeats